jgi:hypothetical protein
MPNKTAVELSDRTLREALGEKTYQELIEIISALKYGSVTLIVQDGKVVQIERNEKFRLV